MNKAPVLCKIVGKVLELKHYASNMRCLLRGKIHRAVVTDANPEYVGSITIDKDLLSKADIWAGERVLISDINNGMRFETYIVEGKGMLWYSCGQRSGGKVS